MVLRSAGFKKDLRLQKSTTYGYYWFTSFKSFLGKQGDCFDRFIIRIREMLESVFIIYQLIPNFLNIFFKQSGLLGSLWFDGKKSLNSLNY